MGHDLTALYERLSHVCNRVGKVFLLAARPVRRFRGLFLLHGSVHKKDQAPIPDLFLNKSLYSIFAFASSIVIAGIRINAVVPSPKTLS